MAISFIYIGCCKFYTIIYFYLIVYTIKLWPLLYDYFIQINNNKNVKKFYKNSINYCVDNKKLIFNKIEYDDILIMKNSSKMNNNNNNNENIENKINCINDLSNTNNNNVDRFNIENTDQFRHNSFNFHTFFNISRVFVNFLMAFRWKGESAIR